MLLGAVLSPAPGPDDEDQGVELSWRAPGGCPTQADVAQRIERALIDRPRTVEDERADVDVEVTENGGGYALVIEVRLGQRVGRRTIEGDACEALADVAALVVAIALDPAGEADFETLASPEEVMVPTPVSGAGVPDETSDGLDDDRAPDPRSNAGPPSAVEPAGDPVVDPRQGSSRPVFFAQAGAGVGVGLLPAVGPSITLAAGPRGQFWAATLGGTLWFRREGRVPDHPEVGGELRLWSIDARGCGIPRLGPVSFPVCGGLAAGMLHGRGVGELEPRTARSAWVAVRAGPGIEVWPVRAFGVWLRAEAVFVAARPTFEVPDRGLVWRANVAALDAALGIAVRFP